MTAGFSIAVGDAFPRDSFPSLYTTEWYSQETVVSAAEGSVELDPRISLMNPDFARATNSRLLRNGGISGIARGIEEAVTGGGKGRLGPRSNDMEATRVGYFADVTKLVQEASQKPYPPRSFASVETWRSFDALLRQSGMFNASAREAELLSKLEHAVADDEARIARLDQYKSDDNAEGRERVDAAMRGERALPMHFAIDVRFEV